MGKSSHPVYDPHLYAIVACGFTVLLASIAEAVAGLIALNVSVFSPAALGAAALIIFITYFSHGAYRDKVQGHIRELRELNNLYLRTVESLALAVDAKDQTTYGHIRRVRAYATELAELSGVTDPQEKLAIETGALLHDIGKLAVDDNILNKPGRLSREEFERMKTHSAAGDEILKQIRFPFPVAELVRSHHERWDGKGYPDGLRGEEIPLGARILTIADAFDAIRSTRSYKASKALDETLDILRADANIYFDPQLVELFCRHIDRLEARSNEAVKNMPELGFRRICARPERSAPAPATPLSPARASAELLSLYEFCHGFGGHLPLPDLLVNLECRIRRLVPCATCVFFLCEAGAALQAIHAGGIQAESIRGRILGIGMGISGWAVAYRRAMMNTRPILDYQGAEGDFSGLRDALVVPLFAGDRCIGTISLYAEAADTYGAADLKLLEDVAKLVGPVIAAAAGGKSEPGSPELDLDPVTGTHRAAYLGLIAATLAGSSPEGAAPYSLMHLRLTKFAELGDLYGPHAQQEALRAVARRLKDEVRSSDALARYGLDGFLVLLAGARREQLAWRAHKIRERVAEIRSGAVRGIAVEVLMASCPEDGCTPFALLEALQHAAPEQVSIPADRATG